MTGEEAGEDGAEDGAALRGIGDAKGLVEVAFEGFEGLAAVFRVLEPGVVGFEGGLAREGLLTSGVPGAGVGFSSEFADPGDEFLARRRSSSQPAEKSA